MIPFFGRIVRRAIVIRSTGVLISPAKGRHNGRSWQNLSEMRNRFTSFFPRGAVSDQDDSHRLTRKVEISRCARAERRDYWMAERLEDLVSD